MTVFLFDNEPNGMPTGTELSPQSYSFQCERNLKYTNTNIYCKTHIRRFTLHVLPNPKYIYPVHTLYTYNHNRLYVYLAEQRTKLSQQSYSFQI